MNDELKKAILESAKSRNEASEKQKQSGKNDVGQRSGVTSGKHLDSLANCIKKDLVEAGLNESDVLTDEKMEIPGWFRATKKWDILAFHDNQLVTAIELKSIFSSYGNNLNNRVEEALGQSTDTEYAINRKLINDVIPPIIGYVMIIKVDDESKKQCKKPASHHFNYDPIFDQTTYIDRMKIACQRFRRESIFGAVWFVAADVENNEVYEPDPNLNYDKFMAEIKGKIAVFKS